MNKSSDKKRSTDGRPQRPSKKQKKRYEYHSSDSDNEQGGDADAAKPLDDSDNDVLDAAVAAATDSDEDQSSGSGEGDDKTGRGHQRKKKSRSTGADAVEGGEGTGESGEEDEDEDEGDENESDADDSDRREPSSGGKTKSKRNDPSAFATSLSKILSTKLSSSKRPDPVLARSAAAHEASKAVVDTALEAKARRHLKEQKRKALEKGRVKDVLLATNKVDGEPSVSTAEVLRRERNLRDVAKRGVIKMFNAVRAAQIKATEADKAAKKSGVIGTDRRKEKINELSKKGFLELIASGGGGLKKVALEEA
ncbi:hypothetical protein GQ602_006449 [Ophiocordyceps camponoti-floridani]|uniref:Ribosomal RNA-processing protein 15 n=1 Tax=Ophiocordyceps camponoti-floridani TaxID=2030778 RepID=A0A8H4Q183_9HYPO|nr:hypothetical protein GQ602_006449 [Ophiocordyceps camponoti-floridani]